MAGDLDRLERTIMISVTNAVMETVNSLENFSACAGIKGDTENAYKAIKNHYGHVGFKGSWVSERVYITNATDSTQGTHKRLPSAEIGLQRAIMENIKNTVRRKQGSAREIKPGVFWKPTEGSTKAFGTANSPKKVLKKVAEQMWVNQMIALDSVTPENTKKTLERKKGRSTQPLVDYGKMKAATRFWVESSGEEDE